MKTVSYKEYAKILLCGTTLEDKLLTPENIIFDEFTPFEIPSVPGRTERLSFSDKKIKFPKAEAFVNDEKKAMALHFFANHELLAIEMMAASLLKFPHTTVQDEKFKRGILATIQDEQRHFKMYLARMRDFGLEFGDIAVNDFFWKQMPLLKTKENYLALMSLTFEMANLDFMQFYQDIFIGVGDKKSAEILKIIGEEEISHVALGVTHLNWSRGNQPLWEYYLSLLPEKMSAARSKGPVMNLAARQKIGVDEKFIESSINYSDDFRVTERKQWKNT